MHAKRLAASREVAASVLLVQKMPDVAARTHLNAPQMPGETVGWHYKTAKQDNVVLLCFGYCENVATSLGAD
jgi:hypothetical protein